MSDGINGEIERLRKSNAWLAERLTAEAIEVGKLRVEIEDLKRDLQRALAKRT